MNSLFHFDANVINARQRDHALNELEKLEVAGLIEIQFSEVTYGEATVGSVARQTKAANYTWAGLGGDASVEVKWRKCIQEAVFPSGLHSESERCDVEALLTAKLSGAVFVTTDGASRTQPRGILGSRDALRALGITVVTPVEALALARLPIEPCA